MQRRAYFIGVVAALAGCTSSGTPDDSETTTPGEDALDVEHNLGEKDDLLAVVGEVTNTGDDAVDITFSASFFDADGTRLEQGSSHLEALSAGTTAEFGVAYYGQDDSAVDNYELTWETF